MNFFDLIFNRNPSMKRIPYLNNLYLADMESIEEYLPVYDLSPNDIQEYIKEKLLELKQE